MNKISKVKTYNKYVPTPDDNNAIRIAILDDDDKELYKDDKKFNNLIKKKRIAIYDNELWAYENDKKIIKEYGNMEDD